MQKELLRDMLAQHKMTSSYALDKINEANKNFRLNPNASSVKFIYRHLAETMNLFTTFFGLPTEVKDTTLRQTDTGQGENIEESRVLVEKGYQQLSLIIETTPEEAWLETIDTPFFGKVSRIRLFSHILFHHSHHTGQISLTLSKGGIIA